MEPAEYLRIVRRRWPVIAVLVLLGLVVSYVTAPSSRPPPRLKVSSSYAATTILSLPSTVADPSGLSLDSMAFLADSGPVAEMTAASLHDPGGRADIESRVQVSAKDVVSALEITASAATAPRASRLANTFGRELIDFINADLRSTYRSSLSSEHSQLNALSAVVSHLQAEPVSTLSQAELDQARSQYVQQYVTYEQAVVAGPGHTGLHIIEPASSGGASLVAAGSASSGAAPTSGSRKKRLALGGAAGLVAGLGVAFVWERLDTRIRTREQAESVFGLPVLGEVAITRRVGRRPGLVVVDDPVSSSAEAFRMLQTGLLMSRVDEAPGSRRSAVLLASPSPLEGKESVLANLAASFSEAGSSVALVAADAFDQSLPSLVRSRRPINRRGRGASFRAKLAPTPAEDARAMPTAIDGVSLLMNGTRPEMGNGHVQRHLDLVSTARETADVVLVDTPPVLITHDASLFSSVVDSVVLMCELGRLSARDASLAADRLRHVGAPLRGVVLVERAGPLSRLPAASSGSPRASSAHGQRVGASSSTRVPVQAEGPPAPPGD
ncbi:MAG: hypothetical protein ACRD0B_00285 [Acidimicrobiales bacterium]